MKKTYFINFTINEIVEERIRKSISINAIIFRKININFEIEEKRRKKFIIIHFDKIILKFLYLQWIIFRNIFFDQIRDDYFRTFLKYLNFVTNRMLSNFNNIIKIHIKDLFEKGKQRLRYMLVTIISDIYIICDLWTLSNNLRLLIIVKYFISEDFKL